MVRARWDGPHHLDQFAPHAHLDQFAPHAHLSLNLLYDDTMTAQVSVDYNTFLKDRFVTADERPQSHSGSADYYCPELGRPYLRAEDFELDTEGATDIFNHLLSRVSSHTGEVAHEEAGEVQ